ncbi:VOC family protein [Actinomadura craniellae]|uniref:VOC family protein n=1 Tax=Actinomadura craniellae TaxID=2231787 RepID=A0A365GYE5_9ACTN|nr:VOC family protein [Actinomadura craniellae]RAY11847.1 VOC family protein [Actinomadura craniellae]
MDSSPITGLRALAFDCADPPALAGWWQRLLGGSIEIDSYGDASLHTPDGLTIDFLAVPDEKVVKNRLHLDLGTTDLAEATEHALALGATRADDVYAGPRWQVLRDPEGNEFCLLRPR